jgi:hypothetical protein
MQLPRADPNSRMRGRPGLQGRYGTSCRHGGVAELGVQAHWIGWIGWLGWSDRFGLMVESLGAVFYGGGGAVVWWTPWADQA